MRDFRLFFSGCDEPEGSSTNPELLDAFIEGTGFHEVTVKFNTGLPFLAHRWQPTGESEHLKVRMGTFEHVFVRGDEPRQLSCPGTPEPEAVRVDELHLTFGQFRQYATLLSSGEVVITLTSAWLRSVKRRGVTLGTCVAEVVKLYDTVFLPRFANR